MGPKNCAKPTNTSSDDVEDLNTCKACKKWFKSLLTHLARSKTDCIKHYTQEEHSTLQKKVSKRQRTQYNHKNSQLIAEKQASYDAKHKTEKAMYYQVNREKILEKIKQQNKKRVKIQ